MFQIERIDVQASGYAGMRAKLLLALTFLGLILVLVSRLKTDTKKGWCFSGDLVVVSDLIN